MKKITLTVVAFSLLLASCGGEEKKEATKETETATETVKTEETVTEKVEEVTEEVASLSGEDIFTSNGCVACHQMDMKTVGPSITEIATAYAGNKDGLTTFFLGEGAAIVDPAQEAVMQPQTEVTKAMSDAERSALADYILK